MDLPPSTRRPRIWVLMAMVAASALVAWFFVDPLPRFRAWWPNRHIFAALDRKASLNLPPGSDLEGLVKGLRVATISPALPGGVPIYIDPAGLMEAGQTMATPVSLPPSARTLGDSVRGGLEALGLTYQVRDGMLTITRPDSRHP